ncbi:MAG: hypothetical protein ACFUZC_14695 [Chthoniobacteraceae bacterium]
MGAMSTPRKNTERLPLRIDRKILEKLKQEAARQELPNVQALAVQILTESVQKPAENAEAKVKTTAFTDIDLRALLLDAHKSIAHLTGIIAAMEAERKK